MKKIEQNKLLELSIFSITIILSIVGVMSVYSAGGYLATVVNGDPFYYVQRQALFVLISVILCGLIVKLKYRFFIDYSLMRKISIGMIVILLLLLILGRATNGAKGWINLGSFSIQPSEFAKLILIWTTSFYFAETRYLDNLPIPEHAEKWQRLWGTHHQEISLGIIYAGIMLPVLAQPDTGGFAIMLVTIALIWLSSGIIEWKKAFKILSGSIVIGYFSLFMIGQIFGDSDYRIRRILVFLNPFAVSADASRQIRNSFYALARGGLTGVGIGNSVQKTGYLPEFHTDFILSIIGEELGILGVLFVLTLLFLLIFLIFRRSLTVQNTFNRYMLTGIGLMFLIQSFLNVAGVTSLAPLTGVTLPFISYGGSSMMTSFIAIGIVLKISIYDYKQQVANHQYNEDEKTPLKRTRMVEKK